MDSKTLFGALSVLLMLCSRSVYFTSIFRGRTKPHAFSWLIWSVISTIGFAAQVAEHAGPGSWARGFSAFTCCLLVVICTFRGEKSITRLDWAMLVLGLSAVPLWKMTQTPVYSVFLVCLIDTVGYMPTARKVWRKPFEEAYIPYVISGCCAFSALLAVENYSISTALYSAVLVCSNWVMAGYIAFRRNRSVSPVWA